VLFKSRRGRREREERGTDERRFSDGNGRKIEALTNRLVFRVSGLGTHFLLSLSLSFITYYSRRRRRKRKRRKRRREDAFL
jgi:hypothetical protein